MSYAKVRAEAFADQVFMVIPHDGSWLHVDEIAEITGLRNREVRAGVEYIRDAYVDLADALLSSQHGYTFSLQESEIAAFRARRCKVALTVIRRTYTGAVQPYLQHLSNKKQSEFLDKQFARVLEDIADLA